MSDNTSNRPLRVFLCHSSGDKPAVRELYRRLKADGFAPWLDEEDLLPGKKWQQEIPKAVRNADVVIVCLSRGSTSKAGYVQKEIKFALDVADEQPEGAIFLIPLKLEDCDVPERLSRWQWVNHFEANGYERLMRSLRHRADGLGLSVSSTTSAGSAAPLPTAKSAPASSVNGGVNLAANTATIGGDVTGRDKIIQAGTYIEHATIIHSGPTAQEVKPAIMEEQHLAPSVLPTSGKPKLAGEMWLSDPHNRRMIGGMEFVRVPAGEFIMGSSSNHPRAQYSERPPYTIDIPYDYWIGKYPVTVQQFAKFAAAAKYQPTWNWPATANCPVFNISWREAMAYCKWLDDLTRSELKNLTLRLPTEAEWEKAARGIHSDEWPWGATWGEDKCNFEGARKRGTTPVGAYSPQGDSPYGVADMVGNAWEWCHSLYREYPYQVNDGRENELDNNRRVVRGGDWRNKWDVTRCAFRGDRDPEQPVAGFRCCLAPAARF